MKSLKEKTINGIFWSLLQKVGSNGISFGVMIVLARLLSPKDFGLIGMLMIFIMVSQAIMDGGFNLALIQKKDVTDEDYSSVFMLNLGVGVLLYLVIFVSAPLIADFYDQRILEDLIRVLSLVFLINAFSLVQEARLTKEINFKTLVIINVPSTIIGGAVSIALAISGFGVWSLVAMQLVTRFVYALQIWFYSSWKPGINFNLSRAKGLFSFGSKLLIARVFGTIYNNLFLLVIGKYFPVSSVGYYQNSFNVATTPSNTLTAALNNVTFSAFSSIQDETVRLKEAYRKIMRQACFWIFPLYCIAAVLGEPLFLLVFGEKWLPAVPYFRWLCVVGIFIPLNIYNLNIVNVKGRSDIFLKLQIARRTLTTVGVIIAIPFGIKGLLIVQALGSVFTFFLFSFFSGRFIGYNVKEQILDIFPLLLISILAGVGVFFTQLLLEEASNVLRILLGFSIGVVIYWLMVHLIRIGPYLEIKNLFQQRFKFPSFR